MNINNKGKSNYESILSNSSYYANILNIIEIPLQSSTDAQLEVLTMINYFISKYNNEN